MNPNKRLCNNSYFLTIGILASWILLECRWDKESSAMALIVLVDVDFV
jgi:hypothetical protein